MIDILIFLYSLYSYFQKRYIIALVLFIFFCYRFLRLVPRYLITIDGPDYAILAMLIAFLFGAKRIYMHKEDVRLRNYIVAMFVFLIISFGYSIIRYELSPSNVFMASRMSFILPCYFLLKRVREEWIEKALTILYVITVIHGLLYVVQCTTGIPVMGQTAEFDSVTNSYRFLNFPPLNDFFLMIGVLSPNSIKLPKSLERYKSYFPLILMASTICTFGRLRIIVTFGILLYGLWHKGRVGLIIRVAMLSLILALSFSGGLTNRMDNEGDTKSDTESLFNGGVQRMASTGVKEGGTFTYRIAMLYERIDRLSDEKILDPIFGYGMEYNKDAKSSIVNFKVGPALNTADISYPVLIVKYGFLGTFIYLLIWFRMAVVCRRYRNINNIALCTYLFIISTLLHDFTGSQITYFSWMMFPLLMTIYIQNKNA